MAISSLFLYVVLFVSLFFEIFLLITYFEIREEIKFEKEHSGKEPRSFPSVTIIVPALNEELTVAATVDSLLALNYPKDKFELLLIDDGSNDKTLEVFNTYKNNPQVRVFTKKNDGSKFAALNFGLEHTRTELVGCLDADSFVDPDALKHIVPHFENETVMAVTPSVRVHEPKTILQHIQRVEYSWGVFQRRILSSMDALYVTPGPFSIFRVSVFKELGGYRRAHHTEDMEMALRMQKNKYKIANAMGANVYTVTPDKLNGLLKQRTRWSYGFLNNAFDYRQMFFNKNYGHVGVFILPIATFSIFSTLYAAGSFIWNLFAKIPDHIAKYQAVGMNFGVPHFSINWFAFDTGMSLWLTMATLGLSILLLILAMKTAEGKFKFGKDIVYYLTLYIFIVPLWLARATYSTLLRKQLAWRNPDGRP